MKNLFSYLVKKKLEYIWLTGIVILALLIQLLLLGNNIRNGIELSNTLDLSWQTDSVERLLHGYLAGRDFIFTYGPFFQLLFSIPALLLHQPSYISVLYAPVFLSIINTILLFFVVRFITHEKKDTAIITALLLFVVGLIFYDQNSLFRILLPFVFGVLLFNFVSIIKPFTWKTIIILLLPAVFGTYTFDLFFLCLLITIVSFTYELYKVYRNKKLNKLLTKYITNGILSLGIIVFSLVCVSILLSSNLNYLLYSLDTVQNYQFVMSIPWSPSKYYLLFLFPLGLCLLLIFMLQKTKLSPGIKIGFVFFTIIALVQLKSAFIRADDGHIIMAVYPSIIVSFILFYYLLKEKVHLFLLLGFVGFYLLIPVKSNYFEIFSLQNLVTSLSYLNVHNTSFFSVYKLPNNYYFSKHDFQNFESLIQKNPDKVMVYPYDSFILNAFGQTYNTVGLQMYQYSNSLVEIKTVEALRVNPPQFIILGIDDKGAVRLDNIPNFSRNAFMAKWMLQNYSVDKKANNFFILRYDPDKSSSDKTNECGIYDVDVRHIMQSNIFERVIKSSTYYLGDTSQIRLPYKPNTTEVLIIEDFNNAEAMGRLFEKSIKIEDYQKNEKNLKIIKKYPLPKIKEIFNENMTVKCY